MEHMDETDNGKAYPLIYLTYVYNNSANSEGEQIDHAVDPSRIESVRHVISSLDNGSKAVVFMRSGDNFCVAEEPKEVIRLRNEALGLG